MTHSNAQSRHEDPLTENEVIHPFTGEVIDLTDLEAVGIAWAEVKDHIRELYQLKDRLDHQLLTQVSFSNESKTAHLETASQHFVIRAQSREDWDQRKLAQAYFELGSRANDIIKPRYQVDKRQYKKFLNTQSTNPHHQSAQRLLTEARTVTPRKPSIQLKESS